MTSKIGNRTRHMLNPNLAVFSTDKITSACYILPHQVCRRSVWYCQLFGYYTWNGISSRGQCNDSKCEYQLTLLYLLLLCCTCCVVNCMTFPENNLDHDKVEQWKARKALLLNQTPLIILYLNRHLRLDSQFPNHKIKLKKCLAMKGGRS